MKRSIGVALALLFFVWPGNSQDEAKKTWDERSQDPVVLSFDDLVTLSSTAAPDAPLAARLESVLTIPSVHNDASAADAKPHHPVVENLGPVLRAGLWNIERGLNFELIRSTLTDTNEFERLAGNQNRISDARRRLIESQLATLQNVDVLILNEVDLGMKRTEYRDVARELARTISLRRHPFLRFSRRAQSYAETKGRHTSDSNERAAKGFVPTYAFARDYGGLVGRFKLDWIFVKPFIQDLRLNGQTYWFAPQFPMTMRELNESVEDRISDHPPMTVDLPLLETKGFPNTGN